LRLGAVRLVDLQDRRRRDDRVRTRHLASDERGEGGGAVAPNYEPDALGRRVKAVEGGTTVATLHSGDDIVYEARTESGQGATSTCYLALNGKYLAKIVRENPDPAQTYYLHADMVGSIRAITDPAGEVVARFEYEPFGLLMMSTGPIAAGAHRFTSKPEDGATELYSFGARYYDPEVGGGHKQRLCSG